MVDKWKILIVDDERSNLEVLSHILNPSNSSDSDYVLSVAKTGQSALEKAKEGKPDLILLDIIMPGMNGFETLSKLKQSKETRDIPVIVITGLDSVSDEEKGFSLGAVDYITKPFHKTLVKARIETHLKTLGHIRTIERLGLIDTLTGIANRRSFDSQMTVEWGRAIRENKPISFLMIDVDNFKTFNDTYGHQAGDVVLKTVANILTSSLRRSTDFAARWGGEEFAVLLPNTDRNGALEIAEKLRANVESTTIESVGGNSDVTISAGIACTVPSIDSSIADFIALADKALYTAKQMGKNRVC